MRRYELTDEQYALLAPLVCGRSRLGRPHVDHRQLLNGLFWKLSSGAAWRDVPERYGAWQTIYSRYTQWRKDGTWDQIVTLLQVKLDSPGRINWDEWNRTGATGRGAYASNSLEDRDRAHKAGRVPPQAQAVSEMMAGRRAGQYGSGSA